MRQRLTGNLPNPLVRCDSQPDILRTQAIDRIESLHTATAITVKTELLWGKFLFGLQE